MIKLAYTEAAQTDIIDLYEALVGQGGPIFAGAGLDAVLARCEDLARFPAMGRRRPELDAFGLSTHGISESGRTIVYTRRGNALYIVRVVREETAA